MAFLCREFCGTQTGVPGQAGTKGPLWRTGPGSTHCEVTGRGRQTSTVRTIHISADMTMRRHACNPRDGGPSATPSLGRREGGWGAGGQQANHPGTASRARRSVFIKVGRDGLELDHALHSVERHQGPRRYSGQMWTLISTWGAEYPGGPGAGWMPIAGSVDI